MFAHRTFYRTLRLQKRVTADPRLAIERIDVPVGKDLVLALISERRLQIGERHHSGHVGLGRREVDQPTVVLDLPICARIEQFFDDIDILGAEYVARLELALGVGLYREQLGRIGRFAVAIPADHLRQGRQNPRG